MVSNIFYFHPELCGRFPFWRAYYSNGLVKKHQPATSRKPHLPPVMPGFWCPLLGHRECLSQEKFGLPSGLRMFFFRRFRGGGTSLGSSIGGRHRQPWAPKSPGQETKWSQREGSIWGQRFKLSFFVFCCFKTFQRPGPFVNILFKNLCYPNPMIQLLWQALAAAKEMLDVCFGSASRCNLRRAIAVGRKHFWIQLDEQQPKALPALYVKLQRREMPCSEDTQRIFSKMLA